MSSPSTYPAKTSSQRPSRFTEGTPLTRPDFLSRTQTSNELFLNILSEMDEFEKRKTQVTNRQRGSSSSSNGSCPSPVNHAFPTMNGMVESHGREEARFLEIGARRSFDGNDKSGSGSVRMRASSNGHEIMMQEGLEKVGKLGQKVKGRLRALTSGSVREDSRQIVPYPGT